MLFNYDYEYWQLNAKVTFDGVRKLIVVNEGVTELSIRNDVYSAWVDWVVLRDNAKFLPALRYTGIDPIPGGFTGFNCFAINGWKLILDLTKVKVDGVLFSDDYATAYYNSSLVPQYPATVSQLVQMVATTNNVVTGDIADLNIPSSEEIVLALQAQMKGLLTLKKFLALK